MCLLFLYLNPTAKEDQYSLVLANVRDEVYSRPSKVAHFWEDAPNIIGGQDMFPGKEGGTWLAMNKSTGKISVLLNILQPEEVLLANKDKKGRGFLVVDFVKGTQSGKDYLNALVKEAQNYSGFIQVTLDTKDKLEAAYFTNMADEPPQVIESGTHAFGNNLLCGKEAWHKIKEGKRKFEEILADLASSVSTKDRLVEELLNMLMDNTKYPVDEQMKEQGLGLPEDYLQGLSAICVNIPSANYGSRTHTLILIDGAGNVDYVVKDMKDPSSSQTEWNTYSFKFSIKS